MSQTLIESTSVIGLEVGAPLMLTGGTDVDVRTLTLDEMNDEQLLDCLAAVEDHHQETSANFRKIENFYKSEIARRLEERQGRALLHRRYKRVEIVEEYGTYVYDPIVCKQIKEILKGYGKDEEAAKVIKTYPAYVEVVAARAEYSIEHPERDEVGKSATFDALIRTYGEHPELGPLFKRCRTRPSFGESVKIERKAGA